MVKSPITWYGGKSRIAKWIVSHFPEHTSYLEPFGGGASVLFEKPPSEIETYNDIDLSVSRFFRVLQTQGEEFIRRASLIPYSEVEFQTATNCHPWSSDLELALASFVRWRQSFCGKGQQWGYTAQRSNSGCAESVGVWINSIEKLTEVIDRLRCVQISCRSAFDLIPALDHPEGLIYCDPPYLRETRNSSHLRVYHTELSDQEHIRLAGLLRTCRAAVVVSGHQSQLYDELYEGWRRESKEVPLCAARLRKSAPKRTECLWIKQRSG